MKNENTTKQGPGRPESKVIWPKGRFTFLALAILNGTLDKAGKAIKDARVCTLTLRNHLAKDMFLPGKNGNPDRTKPNPRSLIVQLKDEVDKSYCGKGRSHIVYMLRATRTAANKAKATLRKSKVSTVSVPVTTPAPAPVTTPAPVAVPVTA